jgi:alkylated DNA nucleotide flippase Atl1
MSEFFKDVIKLIIQGKVTSYGTIANYLGVKKNSRELVGLLRKNSKIVKFQRIE